MTANDKRIIFAILSLYLTSTALGRNAPAVRWGHQLVTGTDDVARAAVADSNDGIYFAVKKQSKDASGARTSKGVFLLKYSQQGDQLWSKQLDPAIGDITGLRADDQGNIYVTGLAKSTPERKTKGESDAYFAKYNQAGTQLWARLVGTPKKDLCYGLDVDASGNLYIAGCTHGDFAKPNKGGSDMFIAAYTQTGALLWKDQIGTGVDDLAMDIRVGDNNDVYLCGNTVGSLAGQNDGQWGFEVARYERTGKRLWLYQYGTTAYGVWCMEIGELGHLYLGCRTSSHVGYRRSQRRDSDSCLARITEKGKLLWIRQFGTDGWDGTWDMARFMDGSGDILISGCQIPSKKKCRGYCRRYTSEGKLIWIKEFRKSSSRGGTCGRVVAIDSANNCYHAGQTNGNQFGVNNGTPNVYIVRFDEVRSEK